MIEWPTGVNKTILREGTSWSVPLKVIADKTRSGKRKVRAAHSNEPEVYKVKMMFSLAEYRTLKNWFNTSLGGGVYSFSFPEIDNNTGTLKEYRWNPESEFSTFENIDGDYITVTFDWIGG